MSIEVRRFKTGDGEGAFGTFVRSVRALGSSAYSPAQIEAWLSGMDAERMEARLRAMTSFIALEDGLIIGFASLDSRHAELDFLYVEPSYAMRGIGRLLAERVEEAAREMLIDRLFIVASLNALPVYEKLGYRKEFDMSKTIDGVKVPCIRMGKDLGLSV